MLNTQQNNESNILEIDEHFNLSQLLVFIVNANLTNCIWGRGTGKSTGVVAPRMVHCAKAMPRMAGTFLAPSYRKFMDHMWPGLRKGFTEKMKLKEGRDFLFLKEPPEHWPRPYMAPGSFSHFIPFRNGSGYHIISFDHNQTANALDTDCNITDEAKLIDGERAQEEVYNTMRGNLDKFGDMPEHYSKWILSDKYIRSGSKHSTWFTEYKEQVDRKLIQEILLTVVALQESVHPKLIAHLQKKLWALQKKAVYYSEASTLDNIHAVGIEYIEGLAKTNSAYGILTSLFNEDIKRTDGKNLFYPLFSEAIHTYNASDNNRVDELIAEIGYDNYLEERTCRLDNDVLPNQPLMMLLDLGGTYNWGLIGQSRNNTVKFLKDFCIEKPKKLRDLAIEFAKYYSPHKRKLVKLYWPKDMDKEGYSEYKTDIDKFIGWLEELGWNVEDMMPTEHRFIPHKLKYDFGCLVFDNSSKRDDRFPRVIFNASNCFDTITSISNARLTPGEVKYEKFKRGEKNLKADQKKEPHLSDAFDWLIIDYLPLMDDGSSGYSVSLHTLEQD